jgi:hypothetical protein
MSNVVDIPPSMLAGCVFCANRLHTNQRGTWQHVISGWVPVHRYGGNKRGTNSLTLPRLEHVFACELCIDKLKAGIPLGQQTLFGTEYT